MNSIGQVPIEESLLKKFFTIFAFNLTRLSPLWIHNKTLPQTEIQWREWTRREINCFVMHSDPKVFRVIFLQMALDIHSATKKTLRHLYLVIDEMLLQEMKNFTMWFYLAIADPIFAKGGELPQESYISRKRFSHFHNPFLHCFHLYIFIFNTSIALVGIHECIAKIRVSKCPILKYLWDY